MWIKNLTCCCCLKLETILWKIHWTGLEEPRQAFQVDPPIHQQPQPIHWWAPPPHTHTVHDLDIGGRGGWRNSEEFTSTHNTKLCVSDQQPDPLCNYTTFYVRAPALIMIAHPNGLNGFFSSEVNEGAEPGSRGGGVHCGFSSAVNESTAVYVDGRHENRKVHLVTNVTHLHNWSSLCWWWP